MKKFAVVLSVVVSVWMLTPTPQAHASWGDITWSDVSSWWDDVISWFRSTKSPPRTTHTTAPPTARVPELDPSAAGGAMILLLGGVAYIASRRREEDLA